MKPGPSKLASAIVAMYPRGWRDRYAEEMHALFDDRGVVWRDVIDLVRGCGSEWRVSLGDPEQHFVTSGIILMGTPLLQAAVLANGFEIIARAAAPIINAAVSPPSRWILLGIGLAVPFAFLRRAMLLPLESFSTPSNPPMYRAFSWRETGLWLLAFFVASMCLAWGSTQNHDPLIGVYGTFVCGSILLASTGAGADKRHAYQTLRWARRELRRALKILAREECRPPALANGRDVRHALDDVERLRGEIRRALEKVRGAGQDADVAAEPPR